MLPRLKSSYLLFGLSLLFVFLLGYRLHCSNCCSFRIDFVGTYEVPLKEGKNDNFYRIINPKHLQCNAFLEGNKKAVKRYISEGRVVIKQDPELSMKCDDIQRRMQHFAHVDNPGDVPFAVARNIYGDYFMQEVFVGMHYSAENLFCFALDTKSPKVFKDKMRRMANCLPNVHVLEDEFRFSSGGHFQDFAHFECIKHLLKQPKWSYVLLLQNNDLVMKTKSEIAQILGAMNGAQLVGSQFPWGMKNRYPHELMPNAKVGKLYKSEYGRPDSQLLTNISYVHSLNEIFLSREFVHALDTELNMDHLLTIFNKKWYGVDEFLLPTLVFNAHLGLPGQTSKVCWHPKDYGPVRYHVWSTKKTGIKCKSNHKRHSICMLTVEYLMEMNYRHELIGNKIWPSADFGPVLCTIETLKERARLNWPMIGLNTYENLHQVREMRQRKDGTFNLKTFKCPWEK